MLLIFTIIFLASIFIPGSMIAILILNMAIGLILSALHIFAALFPRFQLRQKNTTSRAFASIIIPTYNEPPAIVIQVLEALTRLDYENFEVIVIDNNTKDQAIWKPVEQFIRRLDVRFQFFHEDELSGFKAGALNYALTYVDPHSTYIAVIDADYIVEPNFIGTALSYFTDNDIALVQFPQQYRNCIAENQPIADEYRHFFKIYMNMANHLNCVPSTGTVSIYRRDALQRIGGFNVTALTEDADASLRIYKAGYRGVYADNSIGYGLMPYDIEAYRKQKRRWALGNTQSIKTLFSLYGKIPFWSWIGFLSHLTVWNHLNLLPFTVLAAYAIALLPFVSRTNTHHQLLNIASISIFVTLASQFAVFLIALRGQKRAVTRAWKAFVVHTGMTLLYSEALSALWFQTESTFERTNKFILAKMPNLLKNTYKECFLGLWFVGGIIEAYLQQSKPMIIAAFAVSSAALFSIYYVHRKILPTKSYSKKILLELERKYRKYLAPETQTYEYRTPCPVMEKNTP